MATKKKVVVIGGGFGGLQVAKRLKKWPAEVLVIDRTNHHLFQPLLYEVATAALSAGDIAVPIREILAGQRNAIVLMGEVVAIEKEHSRIRLGNGETISFDYLVVAVGANHSYFGHPEWEVFAPGLKNLIDAHKVRERLLMSFEMAERSDSISGQEKFLHFVVIGAGPTGVEVAGAIAEIANRTMIQDFRRVNTGKTKVFLVEGAPEVLPPYPQILGQRARRDLQELGVEVITGELVTNVTEEGVYLGSRFIPAKNIIWAAGNQASPLLKTLDVPLDRQGRVLVQPDLSVPDFPHIFVIGDAACVAGREGRPVPAIAPAAIQQGRYVAKMIGKRVRAGHRPPWRYRDKGMMATIGTHKAVLVLGKIRMTGYLAWLAWGLIHILYLIGFRNRLVVSINWLFRYWTGQRGARLVERPIDEKHL